MCLLLFSSPRLHHTVHTRTHKNIFFSHFRLSPFKLSLSLPSPSSLSLPPSIPYSHRPTGRPWSHLFLYLAVDLSLSFTQRVPGFDRCFRSRKDSKPPRASIWLIFVCVFSVGISFDLCDWLIFVCVNVVLLPSVSASILSSSSSSF
jgi:hypothetical protein